MKWATSKLFHYHFYFKYIFHIFICIRRFSLACDWSKYATRPGARDKTKYFPAKTCWGIPENINTFPGDMLLHSYCQQNTFSRLERPAAAQHHFPLSCSCTGLYARKRRGDWDRLLFCEYQSLKCKTRFKNVTHISSNENIVLFFFYYDYCYYYYFFLPFFEREKEVKNPPSPRLKTGKRGTVWSQVIFLV